MNPINDAGQLVPSELAALAQQSQAAYNIFPPVLGSHLQCSGGIIIVPNPSPRGLWARITAGPKSVPQPLYSWKAIQDDGTGYGWSDVPGGLTGTYTAASSDGSSTIAADPTTGAVVWLWPDDNNPGYYKFDPPASGGLALLDKTGATVDAACSSLKMDADGVITVSNLSAGHDQLAVTDATATQRGVVNTVAQTWSGDKATSGQFQSVDASAPGEFAYLGWHIALGGAAFIGPGLNANNRLHSPDTAYGMIFDCGNERIIFGSGGGYGAKLSLLDASNVVHNGVSGTGGGGDTFVGGICTALGSAGGNLTVTDGVTSVNPCGQIDFTSGATVTNAGGGVAQVAVSGTTGTNGQSVLSLTYTVTTTYTDIGASIHISIPTAGTYLLYGNVNGVIQGTGGTATLGIRLTDTLGSVLANTLTETVGMSQVSGLQVPCSLGFCYRYVASGAITLTLQAATSGSTPTGQIVGATFGYTRLA